MTCSRPLTAHRTYGAALTAMPCRVRLAVHARRWQACVHWPYCRSGSWLALAGHMAALSRGCLDLLVTTLPSVVGPAISWSPLQHQVVLSCRRSGASPAWPSRRSCCWGRRWRNPPTSTSCCWTRPPCPCILRPRPTSCSSARRAPACAPARWVLPVRLSCSYADHPPLGLAEHDNGGRPSKHLDRSACSPAHSGACKMRVSDTVHETWLMVLTMAAARRSIKSRACDGMTPWRRRAWTRGTGASRRSGAPCRGATRSWWRPMSSSSAAWPCAACEWAIPTLL